MWISSFLKKYSAYPLAVFICAFYSCSNSTQDEIAIDKKNLDFQEVIDSSQNKKKFILPNDEFREMVLSKLKNKKDCLSLDTLLVQLDKRNMSFCSFVKQQFDLDDSCYKVAEEKYPSPLVLQQIAYHDKAIDHAEAHYFKKIGISKKWGLFAVVAYSFNDTIKNFCGRY